MKEILRIARSEDLVGLDQTGLDEIKAHGPPLLGETEAGIYRRSLYRKDDVLYFVGRTADDKALYAAADRPVDTPFGRLEPSGVGSLHGLRIEMTADAAATLGELFPFTRPVSLRNERTTIGMGDRLGVASPGHIRAARKYHLYPVLAQQSLRELDYTGRSFADVVADASFAVFQEGFERGFGADADHMKDIASIDGALAEHMPMITLDLTEVLHPEVAGWDDERVAREYAALEAYFRNCMERD